MIDSVLVQRYSNGIFLFSNLTRGFSRTLRANFIAVATDLGRLGHYRFVANRKQVVRVVSEIIDLERKRFLFFISKTAGPISFLIARDYAGINSTCPRFNPGSPLAPPIFNGIFTRGPTILGGTPCPQNPGNGSSDVDGVYFVRRGLDPYVHQAGWIDLFRKFRDL